MKRIIPFILGTLLAIFSAKANDIQLNDTIVKFNNKSIHIEDSVGQVKVKVFDAQNNPYKTVYEGIFTDNKSFEKWTVVEEFGLQLPFMNKIKPKKDYKMEPHFAGLGWGFANVADNWSFNNVDGVWLKSEKSNEFFFNPIEKIIPIIKNNVGLTTGLGFNWRNYFLDFNKQFAIQNHITTIAHAPVGVAYEYSRLRTFQLTVPLLLEIQPSFGKKNKLFVSGGMVAGINTFSSFKAKYVDGSTTLYQKEKDLNVAPITLDYVAMIGYGTWSFYGKYAAIEMFQADKGPRVKPVSVGVMMNF